MGWKKEFRVISIVDIDEVAESQGGSPSPSLSLSLSLFAAFMINISR